MKKYFTIGFEVDRGTVEPEDIADVLEFSLFISDLEVKETTSMVGACEQIKWERDVAINQLNEAGYEFGAKEHTAKMQPFNVSLQGKSNSFSCTSCGNTVHTKLKHRYLNYDFCPYCRVKLVKPWA